MITHNLVHKTGLYWARFMRIKKFFHWIFNKGPWEFVSSTEYLFCLGSQSFGKFSQFKTNPSVSTSLCEKCPNTEFFLVHIFLYSVRIQENSDQKNSAFGHFSRSAFINLQILDQLYIQWSMVYLLIISGSATWDMWDWFPYLALILTWSTNSLFSKF